MKLRALALGTVAAAALFGGTAFAEGGPTVTFNAAVTNDYLFRGLSQTSGKAAAQGGADVTSGMLYAGTWLSNVDFGPTAGDPGNETTLEYDLYAGVRPTLGPVTFDVGIIRYGYTRAPSSAHYDYWEGKILASHTSGPVTVGGAFYYSPEFFGKIGDAYYYELNGAYAFSNKATLSGAIGDQEFGDSAKAGIDNYLTWNVGVGYPLTDKVSLDFRYWGTEDKATNFYTKTFAGDRLVALVKLAF